MSALVSRHGLTDHGRVCLSFNGSSKFHVGQTMHSMHSLSRIERSHPLRMTYLGYDAFFFFGGNRLEYSDARGQHGQQTDKLCLTMSVGLGENHLVLIAKCVACAPFGKGDFV